MNRSCVLLVVCAVLGVLNSTGRACSDNSATQHDRSNPSALANPDAGGEGKSVLLVAWSYDGFKQTRAAADRRCATLRKQGYQTKWVYDKIADVYEVWYR